MPTPYQFDPTGSLPANRVTGEQHIITAVSNRNYHITIPTYSPFFSESLSISYRDSANNIRFLVEGIDYHLGYQFIAASRSCARPIYGGISYLNLELSGVVTLAYQTVGGEWTIDPVEINEILSDILRNPKVTSWEQIANVPNLFPVVDHEWNLQDLVGMSDVKDSIEEITLAIANAPVPAPADFDGLIATKFSVGLDEVQNFPVAPDNVAMEGTSITHYMTPRATRLANEVILEEIQSVKELVQEHDILIARFTYSAPKISEFLINSTLTTVFERGSIVPTVGLSWILTGNTPQSQFITNGVDFVEVGVTSLVLTGPFDTSMTWSLQVSSVDPFGVIQTDTKSVSLSMQQRRYWGVSPKTFLTSEDIASLSGNEFATNKTKEVTYDASGGRYLYYAYPASFGPIATATVNNFSFSDYSEMLVDFTNNSGFTEPYRVISFNGLQNGSSISVVWS